MKQLFKYLLLLLPYAFACVDAYASKEIYLPYAELIQMVETGAVKNVSLGTKPKFHGVLLLDGETVPFRSYRPTDTSGDPLLMNILEKHEVDILSEKRDDVSLVSAMTTVGFIMLTVPVVSLLFILLVFRCVKRLERRLDTLDKSNTSDHR